MIGLFKALKYRKQLSELDKLVEQAKKMGIIEPDADAGKMMETLIETLNARLAVGVGGMSSSGRKRKKKDDDDDITRVAKKKMPDLDAYMAQQIDMMLTMFDKMFNLYERMDRKFGEIAKRHMQKYRIAGSATSGGQVEKEESFEDKLIEKIIEKYLLGELESGGYGGSAGGSTGGVSLSPNNANEEEVLKALFRGLGEATGSNNEPVAGSNTVGLNNAKEELVEKLEKEVVEDV